jgi:hypothetical protein
METKTNKTLATKIAKIMGEIDHVEKRGKNKEQGYAFVQTADVANMCRKRMAEVGIAIIANEVERIDGEFTTARGTVMHTCRLKTEYTLIDGESGEKLSFCGWGDAFDTSDKAVNKCKTASLKYALRNTFLIPDQSDPEADSTVDQKENQKTVIGCEECGEAVVPFRKPNGTISSVEQIVNASILKHKKTLCAECQLDIAAIEKQDRVPAKEPVKELDGTETITVAEVNETTKGYLKVKWYATSGEKEASVWDKKLWPLFDLAAGKKFVVKIETKESKGKTYNNIVDVLKVGEFAVEDGELVVHLTSKDTQFANV